MTAKPTPAHTPDGEHPFGATPRHSKAPVAVLVVLYALWFLLLFWMAAAKPGA